MTTENATFINQLTPATPSGTSGVSSGDDELRQLKAVLQNTFTGITGAVTATHTVLNTLASNVANYVLRDGSVPMTGPLNMGSQRITTLADPVNTADATNKAYVDNQIASLTSDTAVVAQAWPVGSIFFSGVSTNPATLLGVGTWTPIGQGRMLVGVGTGNDGTVSRTFANGATGGRYEVALTEAQLPAHNHGVFAADATVGGALLANRTSTAKFATENSSGATGSQDYAIGASSTSPNASSFFGSSQNTGLGQRHENMPPHLAVFMWRRTA